MDLRALAISRPNAFNSLPNLLFAMIVFLLRRGTRYRKFLNDILGIHTMNQHHFEKLIKLIEIERDAEKEENKRELEKYPLQVREALGKTVTRLVIEGEDSGVGGLPLLILSRSAGANSSLSPFHSMNQGDNVRLSYPPSSDNDPIDGTLYDVGEFQ